MADTSSTRPGMNPADTQCQKVNIHGPLPPLLLPPLLPLPLPLYLCLSLIGNFPYSSSSLRRDRISLRSLFSCFFFLSTRAYSCFSVFFVDELIARPCDQEIYTMWFLMQCFSLFLFRLLSKVFKSAQLTRPFVFACDRELKSKWGVLIRVSWVCFLPRVCLECLPECFARVSLSAGSSARLSVLLGW